MTMIQIPPAIVDAPNVLYMVIGWTILYVIFYFGYLREIDSTVSTIYKYQLHKVLALSIWFLLTIFLLNYAHIRLVTLLSPFGAFIILVLVASIVDIVMVYRSNTRIEAA